MNGADPGEHGTAGFRDLQQGPALWPKQPKPAPVLQEYPKLLSHPQHVPARQPVMHERVENRSHLWGASRTTWTEPGNPGRWPPVTVNNERDEQEARALGYEAAGRLDPTAMERSEIPAGFVAAAYPKYLASHDRIVASLEEELRLTGGAPALPPVPAQAPQPPLPPEPQELQSLRAEIAALRTTVQPAQAVTCTPNIGARNKSEAQARVAANISHSAWRKLITAGFLSPDRQADPIAIVAAQERARQADDAARIAAEQDFTTDQRI